MHSTKTAGGVWMDKSQRHYLLNSWKFFDSAPGEGIKKSLFAPDTEDSDWFSIQVPGDVHRVLIDNGRIPDPFIDRNEDECLWMEEREWWFRCAFKGPEAKPGDDERWLLVFDGLDTFASIWLNGEAIGSHRNMFCEAVYDVSDRLLVGRQNVLAVCFDPPLAHAQDCGPFASWGPNPERVAMRKAQFCYGWDWGPRLPGIGIWRPVHLMLQKQAALSGVHFYTLSIENKQAVIGIRVEAEAFAAADALHAEIELFEPGQDHVKSTAAMRTKLQLAGSGKDRRATAYLVIDQPKLWWTHELGSPDLYALRVKLIAGNQVVDEQLQEAGIRTIELDQSVDTDEPGTRFFRFILNGVPIFAKGADWIPADSFVAAIPDERYQRLLTGARQANMTMLRIWGGGIYEHDAFYDLCDRYGILIWQDFMFACAMYPDHDPAFRREVENEARYQVRRLRNHPCLALWCGNNENQWIHDKEVWEKGGTEPVPGSFLYHHLLPRIVAELDGRIPYWPGSPYGGNDHNSMEDGDRHNWTVWHGDQPRRFGDKPQTVQTPAGVSFLHYLQDQGRFISEFGMHASPVFETLRRVIPAEQLYHHSPAMDHHNKDFPKNKGDNLMQSVTGLPNDLDEYIDFSMIAQAEGLKCGIEHFRRRKPHCSGALFWQFNDCWPVLSWSVIDYNGFGKAGYYAAKRSYAPVLASFKPCPDGSIELWVTNDRNQPLEGDWMVENASFSGAVAMQTDVHAQIAAQASQCIARWTGEQLEADAGHYLWVEEKNNLTPVNRHFFVPIKELQRLGAQVRMKRKRLAADQLEIELQSDGYALCVHLAFNDAKLLLSDNYFDLPGGKRALIEISGSAEVLDGVEMVLRWR